VNNTAVTILMACAFVLLVGVDVYLAVDGKDGNTYSERIRAWGKGWPPFRLLLAASMGGLLVHWFGC
jgi:hypothetical protein